MAAASSTMETDETTPAPAVSTESELMATPASKTSTVGVKMVKKKRVNLNASKTKLKSVPATPVNFSFHNMSIQKQTLRANNKALAHAHAKTKLELRQTVKKNTELEIMIQGLQQEVRRLQRVVGIKDTEIEDEVHRRMQTYMKEMKKVLEATSEYMVKMSQGISEQYQKCVDFCSSTASSRASSLGNTSAINLLDSSNNSQRRSSASRRSSFASLLQAEYLSKADEVASNRHGDSMTSSRSGKGEVAAEPLADMSVILEQSILSEETTSTLPIKPNLPTVSELTKQDDNGLVGTGRNSKLPQRIPRQISGENLHSQSDKDKSSKTEEKSERQNDSDKNKNNDVLKPKSKKRVNSDKSDKNEIQKKKTCQSDDSNDKTVAGTENSKRKARQNIAEPSSVDLDAEVLNLSGEDFENLVSGSPIMLESEKSARRQTFTLSDIPPINGLDHKIDDSSIGCKSKLDISTKPDPKESKDKTSSESNRSNVAKNKSNKLKTGLHVRRNTYVAENPFQPNNTLKRTPMATDTADEKQSAEVNRVIENPFKQISTLKQTLEVEQSQKEADKNNLKEKKEVKNQTKEKITKLQKQQAKSKLHKAPDTSVSNPKQKPEDKNMVTYPMNVENPFKPTRSLLRSPPPQPMLDSRQFLAKLCDRNGTEEPLADPPEGPTFADEPTTYFNADMDLTVPLSAVVKTSPFLNCMEQISESSKLVEDRPRTENELEKKKTRNDHGTVKDNQLPEVITETKDKTKEKNADKKSKKEKTNNEEQTKSQRDSIEGEEEKQKATVEMRIDKPGKFTFAASRKEADGSRKPVPEKVSRGARSKKKIVTPEKDPTPPNLGPDRDLFNFGDRTPTVPLNKILQEKASSVYDISMNESVIAAPVSLNNFREKNKVSNDLQENTEKEKENSNIALPDQSGGTIYHLPLKGSPQEKPKKTRGRSKSGTRSKSRKLNDSDDEDYVPYKSRSRSNVRRRDSDDDYVPDSRSKTRSRTRGRSRSRKCEKTESKIVDDNAEMQNDKTDQAEANVQPNEQDLTESPLVRKACVSRSRAIITSEDLDDTDDKTSDKENFEKAENKRCLEHVTDRKSHSKSKDNKKVSDDQSDLNVKDQKDNDSVGTESKKKSNESEKPSVKEKEPSNIYYLPLKGSPSETKAKTRTRSKSRTRYISDSEEESQGRRTRSKSRTRHVLESEDEGVEKRTSRSRRPHSVTKNASETEIEQSDKKIEQSDKKSLMRSRSRSKVVKDSSDDLSEKNNDDHENMDKIDKQKDAVQNKQSIAVLSVGDSDSDFQSETRHRRKSKRQNSSQKDIDSDINSDKEIPRKSTGKEILDENKVFREDIGNLSESSEKSEPSIEDPTRFVTTSCRRSGGRVLKQTLKKRVGETVDGSDGILEKCKQPMVENICSGKDRAKETNKQENESSDPISNHRKSKINENSKETKDNESAKTVSSEDYLSSKTPSVKSVKVTKASKSVKMKLKENDENDVEKSAKVVKKGRDKDTEEGTQDSNQLVQTSREKTKSTVNNKQLPTKTPSLPKEPKSVSSKTSSRTKTEKSARKKKEPVVTEDQTPKGKGEKDEGSSRKKVEKENAEPVSRLASLKRRLTALSSQSSLQPESNAEEQPKQDEIDPLTDGGESSENKRARRTKKEVSYVSLPLNKKLRQGDTLFQSKSPITKEKAEKARIALGQRRTILSEKIVENDTTCE